MAGTWEPALSLSKGWPPDNFPSPFLARPVRSLPKGRRPGGWLIAAFSARPDGGEGGIRTHGPLSGTRDFQSRLFGHSSTSPSRENEEASPGSMMARHFYNGLMPAGGEGGIRTHDEIAPIPVFETGAFNRSATSPSLEIIAWLVASAGLGRRRRRVDTKR